MGLFSFHKNREKEEEEKAFRQKTEEMLTKLAEEMEKSREQAAGLAEEMRKGQELTETLSRDVRQAGVDVRRHDMTLEECLIGLEDCQNALENQQEERRQSQEQIRKLEGELEKLWKLLAVYQEQFWGMKRYAQQKDPAWLSQLELVEKAAQGGCLSCGISWIDQAGVPVDYELHEVIEARAVSEEQLDMQVAEIYSPGMACRGQVKKKARVAAYRLERQG